MKNISMFILVLSLNACGVNVIERNYCDLSVEPALSFMKECMKSNIDLYCQELTKDIFENNKKICNRELFYRVNLQDFKLCKFALPESEEYEKCKNYKRL